MVIVKVESGSLVAGSAGSEAFQPEVLTPSKELRVVVMVLVDDRWTSDSV